MLMQLIFDPRDLRDINKLDSFNWIEIYINQQVEDKSQL